MEIHPSAFATELIKMIAAKIGQRYLIIKTKIFLRRNGIPLCVTSSSILSTPITLETSRQVANAAIGIITEFVRTGKESGFLTVPAKLILKGGNAALGQRNGACESGK